MNQLSFKIIPDTDSNFQLSIYIDENELLKDDSLGVDPHQFFSQESLFKNGRLLIGICSCGVEGCSDSYVTVSIENDSVKWTNGLNLIFDLQEYKKIIDITANDFSWETVSKRTERLVSEALKNSKTKHDETFDWASNRIKNNKVVLSYSKNGKQQLFEFYWDEKSIEDAVEKAKEFKMKYC